MSVGEPCSNDGSPLDLRSEVPAVEMKDVTDWTPFWSCVEFKTAEFLFKCAKMSTANINILCTLWADTLNEFSCDPPFLSHSDLYNKIDSIPIGGIPWQSASFTYSSSKNCPNVWTLCINVLIS